MLHEFAITPDIFDIDTLQSDPKLDGALPFILDKLADHALIANLHSEEWVLRIKEQLPDKKVKKISEWLKVIKKRNRLVSCSAYSRHKPTCAQDWLDAADEVHQEIELQGILVGKKIYDENKFGGLPLIEACDFTEYNQWGNMIFSQTVETAEYRKYLEPAIRYAKKVMLIDPFINPYDSDYRELIEFCFDIAGQKRHKAGRHCIIEIHAGNPDDKNFRDRQSVADRLSEWKKYLTWLSNEERKSLDHINFDVTLWKKWETSASMRLHDRYIITNQCGIGIQYGLRLQHGNTTTWSLMSEDICAEQEGKFNEAGSYEKLGSIKL